MKRYFKAADNPIDDLVIFNKGDNFHLSPAIAHHFLYDTRPFIEKPSDLRLLTKESILKILKSRQL